jgi:hypothetical protein
MTNPEPTPTTPPPVEPWLPIETWLIGSSLALGAVLLVVLLWLSARWFPVGG